MFAAVDHQKLEREARICRLLKHPNIGTHCNRENNLCELSVVSQLKGCVRVIYSSSICTAVIMINEFCCLLTKVQVVGCFHERPHAMMLPGHGLSIRGNTDAAFAVSVSDTDACIRTRSA